MLTAPSAYLVGFAMIWQVKAQEKSAATMAPSSLLAPLVALLLALCAPAPAIAVLVRFCRPIIELSIAHFVCTAGHSLATLTVCCLS